MEVGEVPKGIRWSAKARGPPKFRIGGVSGRGRGLIKRIRAESSKILQVEIQIKSPAHCSMSRPQVDVAT